LVHREARVSRPPGVHRRGCRVVPARVRHPRGLAGNVRDRPRLPSGRTAWENAMTLMTLASRAEQIVRAVGEVVVGKDDVLRRILAGMLANGHVLIEDYPGLAKTLIARLLAQSLGLAFKRIQFTPDLLPSDVT